MANSEKIFGLLSVLASKTGWENLSNEAIDKLADRPLHLGQQFTAFLQNDGKVVAEAVGIIAVNCDHFNPTEFIGSGWSVLETENDSRSTEIISLDLTKVQFVTMLDGDEKMTTGAEEIKRLRESVYIGLGIDAFVALWENRNRIPDWWKEKADGNIRFIFFDGVVLLGPDGEKYSLGINWINDSWCWFTYKLAEPRDNNGQSAVVLSD